MLPKMIRILQVISVAMIWVLVVGIVSWMIHLIRVSYELNDSFHASLSIGVIVIPLFVFLASILTYVFWGLHRKSPDHSEGQDT